jgi:AAA ATPase domain
MKFLGFTIRRYRGILTDLTINLRNKSLVPIIGVNECGKTTILSAILAFDSFADDWNEGRHLENLQNLTTFEPSVPQVCADIESTRAEFLEAVGKAEPAFDEEDIDFLRKSFNEPDLVEESLLAADFNLTLEVDSREALDDAGNVRYERLVDAVRMRRALMAASQQEPIRFQVTRDLLSKNYSVEIPGVPRDAEFGKKMGEEVVRKLPYILYFDDFRHEVPPSVEFNKQNPTEWAEMLAALFKRADTALDVYELPKMEDRIRKSAIAKAEKHLNDTLTRRWEQFNLERRNALSLALNYDGKSISFDVVETDQVGEKHFFSLKDRSKGFFWFFNFVMRLEFNPKQASGEAASQETVYLLDEPGSYLHAAAQSRLCQKLVELSKRTTVLYCTHSHHLLEPQLIPISNVLVAEKDASGSISASSITSHRPNSEQRRIAFQPVYEALQLSPTSFDFSGRKVLACEGMYDYFAFDAFRPDASVAIFPCVGADSLRFVVSLLIASGVDYRALWDNDTKGREAFAAAKQHFGAEIAGRHFRLLPLPAGTKAKKRILQDLFDGEELVACRRELEIPENSSFEKLVLALYYAPDKDSLVRSFKKTSAAFRLVFEETWM